MALDQSQRSLGIGRRVERQRWAVLRVAVAVRKLSLFLLEVRRIEEEDAEKVARTGRAVDRAGEAVLDEQRQRARMIEVSVAQDHGRERGRVYGKGSAVARAELLQALEESAVEEHLPGAGIDQVLRAGHRSCGAEEAKSGCVRHRRLQRRS